MHTNRRNQKIFLFTRGATIEWARISIVCGCVHYEDKMTFAQVIKCLNTIRDEADRKVLKAYFKSLY